MSELKFISREGKMKNISMYSLNPRKNGAKKRKVEQIRII